MFARLFSFIFANEEKVVTLPLNQIGFKMIFGDIRLKIAKKILHRKSLHLKRQKQLHDFTTARLVGVLCSSTDEAETKLLKDFLSFLTQKGISYKVLGYFPFEEIPENYLYGKQIDFFTRSDLNFWGIPKSASVEQFMAQTFDMLINCSMNKSFPTDWVMRLSKAKCKIGIGDVDINDLSIDIDKKDLGYYLINVKKYLSNLIKSE